MIPSSVELFNISRVSHIQTRLFSMTISMVTNCQWWTLGCKDHSLCEDSTTRWSDVTVSLFQLSVKDFSDCLVTSLKIMSSLVEIEQEEEGQNNWISEINLPAH